MQRELKKKNMGKGIKNILFMCLIVGIFSFGIIFGGGKIRAAEEGTEATSEQETGENTGGQVAEEHIEGEIESDLTFNTSCLYIGKNTKFNGHTIIVNGDVVIENNAFNDDLYLGGGALIVNGNIRHPKGRVKLNGGLISVTGNYTMANVQTLPDGTQRFSACNASIDMYDKSDEVKIGGDLLIHSSYDSNFRNGTLEIGGNLIDDLEGEGISSNNNIKFVGNREHRIETSGWLGTLSSEGKLLWKGSMGVYSVLSDLEIEVVPDDGKDYLYCSGLTINNGETINITGNVRSSGIVKLSNGQLLVNGNYAQMKEELDVGQGTLSVTGDLRVQLLTDTINGVSYKESMGNIDMTSEEATIKVGRNFVIQSRGGDYNWYTNYFSAGTIEIGGDFTQLNGSSSKDNIVCTNKHRVVLNGDGEQSITFESESAKFATLCLTKPESSYTFSRKPCWDKLESSGISISECTINNIPNKSYTGKAIKPNVVITDNGKTLIKGKDYTLTYSENVDIGTAKVTINGMGDYNGSAEKTFKIVFGKPSNFKAASKKKNEVTLTWKTVSKADGYTLEYARDKVFKKGKGRITIKKGKVTSQTIKKLLSRKTYYFRIRAYKKVNGKKEYSTYARIVKVKL